jgi:hypothetical protein
MAKAKTRTFVKTIDGREYVQVAHSPGDAVQLSFNGWRERIDDTPTTTPPASASTPKKATARPADKPAK